jgi:hypothetical protein
MAIVVKIDPDGTVWCLQMVKHCSLVRLQDITPLGEIVVVPCPDGVDRDKSVMFANLQLGVDYGDLDIVSIAINICLPSVLGFDVHKNDTLICSALVARSWEHGGYTLPRGIDPFTITPGQFYLVLGVAGYSLKETILHKGS